MEDNNKVNYWKNIKKLIQELRKKDLEASMTFSKVCSDWLRIQQTRWKPKTYKNNIGRLRLHVLPVLGTSPMSQITFEDIKAIPLKLEQDGKYDGAKKIALIINQICEHARLNKWSAHNIADGLTKVLAGYIISKGNFMRSILSLKRRVANIREQRESLKPIKIIYKHKDDQGKYIYNDNNKEIDHKAYKKLVNDPSIEVILVSFEDCSE